MSDDGPIEKRRGYPDTNVVLSEEVLELVSLRNKLQASQEREAKSYNEGYADAMLRKAGCCEANEDKLAKAVEALKFTASGPWLDNAAVKYCEQALKELDV
jgi:hypothetical protein